MHDFVGVGKMRKCGK